MSARWRGDGQELFYIGLDGTIMAVPVNGERAELRGGTPVPLFAVHPPAIDGTLYDVTADGKKFLVNSAPESQGSPPLAVLVNWTSLLKKPGSNAP